VTGDADDAPVIGKEMTSNPIVRKLGFTGSTEIGKLLMAQCAAQVKKVSLELGGNAAFIVFDDADLEAAIEGALICKYRNSGQTCISANRILVQDAIYDEFVSRLVDAASKLKVGSGLDPDTKVGPLIERSAVEKVERHIADALDRGGELLLGGEGLVVEGLGDLFWQPTVIAGVVPEAAMSCEETFGPVAGIARFATEEQAIGDANDTPYGLAAYYYTRDMGRIWRLSEALEYGIHGINTGLISSEVVPFGGVKESGIGREGSRYGIDEWLEIKYLSMAGIDS
jgi:succinate-semialdehyde dehydrogenase/glutarate-semialdehyde dehydrogenase